MVELKYAKNWVFKVVFIYSKVTEKLPNTNPKILGLFTIAWSSVNGIGSKLETLIETMFSR